MNEGFEKKLKSIDADDEFIEPNVKLERRRRIEDIVEEKRLREELEDYVLS